MSADPHELFREKIDHLLAEQVHMQHDTALSEHLRTCQHCREHLASSTRVLAALRNFSFEVEPSLQTKVFSDLHQRGQQLAAASVHRRRLAWACALAIVFTVVGSFLDIRFADIVASHFGMPSSVVHGNLLTFWIIPSTVPVLLFPFLPLLNREPRRAA